LEVRHFVPIYSLGPISLTKSDKMFKCPYKIFLRAYFVSRTTADKSHSALLFSSEAIASALHNFQIEIS